MRTSLFLADLLAVTERYANYLLSERRALTPEKAKRLEAALGISRLALLYPEERQGKTLRELVEESRAGRGPGG